MGRSRGLARLGEQSSGEFTLKVPADVVRVRQKHVSALPTWTGCLARGGLARQTARCRMWPFSRSGDRTEAK